MASIMPILIGDNGVDEVELEVVLLWEVVVLVVVVLFVVL